MSTPYELRAFPGAAADTTLNGGIDNTTFGFNTAVGTGGGYPDGTTGPFFIVMDYDNTSAEKIHCVSRIGDAFVADERGADGTTALPHSDGAKIRACFTATDAQEANRAAHNTVGLISAKGDVLTGISGSTMTKTGIGPDGSLFVASSAQPSGVQWTKTVGGLVIGAGSTIGGISGTQIAADSAQVAANTTAITTLTTDVNVQGTAITTLQNQFPPLLFAAHHAAVPNTTFINSTPTLTIIDGTNLTFTFTPTSTSVLIRLSALMNITGSAAFGTLGIMVGAATIASSHVLTPQSTDYYVSVPFLVTGLTVGTPLTYAWAFAGPSGGGQAELNAQSSGGAKPFTEVWAA